MNSNIEDLIRHQAYAIWERDGRPEGQSDTHWHRAALEVIAQSGFKPATKNKASRKRQSKAA